MATIALALNILTAFGLNVVPVNVVPVNNVGMVTRLGSVRFTPGGLNYIVPFLDTSKNMHVGFDTDFTHQVHCITKDHVKVTFPTVYIDNNITCPNDKCYVDLYTKYFLSDSKVKAKGSGKVVPEDGTIFKHLPEAMSIACSKVRAYEMHHGWHKLYPSILDVLRKLVPDGVNVIAVRADPPIIPDVLYTMSVFGMIHSYVYVWLISWFN
jgi:hypothetical protein